MLFRKKIEPRCGYCRYARSAGPELIICRKRGIMPTCQHCRSFRYDPLQRTPSRPAGLDFSKYDDRDYSL